MSSSPGACEDEKCVCVLAFLLRMALRFAEYLTGAVVLGGLKVGGRKGPTFSEACQVCARGC